MDKILCPIADQSSRNGDGSFMILSDSRLSYRECDRRISVLASELTAQGVIEGSRVALLSDSDELTIALLFALWRIGAVPCPLSPRIPATQVREMIKMAGCTFVLDKTDKLPVRSSKTVQRLAITDPADNSGMGHDISEKQWHVGRPATIVFTSGSSGYPKAAVHSLANHYCSALGSNENIALGSGDRWLLSLPLYHVGGLAILFRTTIAGAAIVLPPQAHDMAAVIDGSGVTHVSMVSTQLYRLLSHPESLHRLSRLKAILLGGSAVPRQLAEAAWSKGLPIYLSYGLTEMSSQVTATRGEYQYNSGRTLKYRELKIADDGEILARGETLFLGYSDNDKIEPSIDDNGWFHTGDIGELDSDRNLSVIGRKDNMFISGGENIHPEEIEAALMAIDEVVEAVVVPVKNPEFGFRPVAFVKTEPAREITADDLKSLPSFKIPIQFYAWPGKHETGGIKLDRRHFHKLVKDMYRHF